MLLVSPDTIRNPAILRTRSLPRRFGGRALPWPRRAGWRIGLRSLIELQALRYTLPLLPLLVIGFTWPQTALALAQAPLLMFMLIWAVEMRTLRLTPKARARLLAELGPEADRLSDLLAQRGRAILARIAAGRGLTEGELLLVVEQSELARMPPLTWVSVQSREGAAFPPLSPEEKAILRADLFDGALSEAALLKLSLATGQPLRMVEFDARAVTGHQRIAALIARSKAAPG